MGWGGGGWGEGGGGEGGGGGGGGRGIGGEWDCVMVHLGYKTDDVMFLMMC